MIRTSARFVSAIRQPLACAAALLAVAPATAHADYACNFVEVECDRAAKAVRVVPFRAEADECVKLRALKDAEWLVDVARHVRMSGKDRVAPGAPKVVRCELAEGKSVAVFVQGTAVNTQLQGRCGAVFSAIVTIEDQQPHKRRVVNELNLLADCTGGGAADRIEYLVGAQKVLIQWLSEPQFGALERTVLARRHLEQAANAKKR
jgi:hypothetical protein